MTLILNSSSTHFYGLYRAICVFHVKACARKLLAVISLFTVRPSHEKKMLDEAVKIVNCIELGHSYCPR